MEPHTFAGRVGPALAAALARRGFTTLTAVQEAILDPALLGRDLRITSQTGSGKTVAVGFALRGIASVPPPAPGPVGRPLGLVITPTRELAKQFEEELRWLYADLGTRVATATGGASVRDERRALARGAAIVVGTPGRLLDHLERGALVADDVEVVVLDEADRMLDLGFREELLGILSRVPDARRTHLVSATFPADVRSLADRVQREAAHVEGTRLGAANTDIAHVVHVVDARQRLDAIVNLLLADVDAQTLIFARTRADVGSLAAELHRAGFAVGSLSGEMEQAARNRALAAFRGGQLHVLVATDVAARGIDVQDVTRVIHADAPSDVDGYVHRSGRTGRAGRKGTSSVLVAPAGVGRLTRVLQSARVTFRFEPIPTADAIRRAADDRLVAELARDAADTALPVAPRVAELAQRLVDAGDATRVLARLLVRAGVIGKLEPRDVRPIAPPKERPRHDDRRDARPGHRRDAPPDHRRDGRAAPPDHRRDGRDAPPDHRRDDRPPPARAHASDASHAPREAGPARGSGVPFRISWGTERGADARRLLAMVCRRGDVRGSDVGAIRLARNFSIVEIAPGIAEAFARAAAKPDPRDPRITIRRDGERDGDRPPPRHRPQRS